MSLTINGYILGEVTPRAVNVRELVGAHDLVFVADAVLNSRDSKGVEHTAEIYGAQVLLKGSNGQSRPVGVARPERPIHFRFYDFIGREQVVLSLTIYAHQFAAIEEARDGGDIEFQLLVNGRGTDQHGGSGLHGDWKFHVPRSTWIQTLHQAKVMDILLFELPVPLGSKTPEVRELIAHIEKARKHFLEGDYPSCVGQCRTVVQELGNMIVGDAEWATPMLKKLSEKERANMSKQERELAIFAAVRNYAHLPHHGPSEGGSTDYSRSDAQFALTLTATLAARVTRA